MQCGAVQCGHDTSSVLRCVLRCDCGADVSVSVGVVSAVSVQPPSQRSAHTHTHTHTHAHTAHTHAHTCIRRTHAHTYPSGQACQCSDQWPAMERFGDRQRSFDQRSAEPVWRPRSECETLKQSTPPPQCRFASHGMNYSGKRTCSVTELYKNKMREHRQCRGGDQNGTLRRTDPKVLRPTKCRQGIS
jgi:hypothetical protein